MTTKDPLDKETDADEWHRERVLSGEFEEIPTGRDVVQVEVPEEVEAFVRKRYHDLDDRGEETHFADLLMDHMDVQFEFVLQEPAPANNEWVITNGEDDDQER